MEPPQEEGRFASKTPHEDAKRTTEAEYEGGISQAGLADIHATETLQWGRYPLDALPLGKADCLACKLSALRDGGDGMLARSATAASHKQSHMQPGQTQPQHHDLVSTVVVSSVGQLMRRVEMC